MPIAHYKINTLFYSNSIYLLLVHTMWAKQLDYHRLKGVKHANSLAFRIVILRQIVYRKLPGVNTVTYWDLINSFSKFNQS